MLCVCRCMANTYSALRAQPDGMANVHLLFQVSNQNQSENKDHNWLQALSGAPQN